MSVQEPGECRTLHCGKDADYWAEVRHIHNLKKDRRTSKVPKAKEYWSGEFCTEHLARVLPDVAADMRSLEVLMIERIKRA